MGRLRLIGAAAMALCAQLGFGGDKKADVPYNGSFSTQIPIQLPGFRGLEPQLAISYQSTQGNGPLGVGMRLVGESVIQRQGSGQGIPRYDDTDTYNLDGANLLPCELYGGTHCTEVNNYSRIAYDPANDRWEVTGTSGNKATYGAVSKNARGTFRWRLEQLEDPRGNTVRFSYQCHEHHHCYLKTIRYNQTEVGFNWSSRPDVVSYATGSTFGEVRWRLAAVTVSTLGEPVRAYGLAYAQGLVSEASLLESVTLYGRDFTLGEDGQITGGTHLPPTVFTWNKVPADEIRFGYKFAKLRASEGFGVDGHHIAGDWNGDGRTDLLALNTNRNYGWVALANGDGSYTFHKSMPPANLAHRSYLNEYKRIHVGDWNGDGCQDILHLHPSTPDHRYSWVALSGCDGSFDFQTSLPGSSTSTNSYLDTSFRQMVVGDWNGDGRSDLLHLYPNADPQYSFVALSNGDGTFDFKRSLPGASVTTKTFLSGPRGTPAKYRVIAGDWNADGLTDILHLHPDNNPNHSWVGLSNGDGTFAFKDSLPGSSTSTRSYTHSSYPILSTGDFNGDGATDLVYRHPGGNGSNSWIALSKGDGTFDFRNTLPSPSPSANYGAHPRFNVADLNGDGRSDLFYIFPSSDPRYSWYAISRGDGTFHFRKMRPKGEKFPPYVANQGVRIADVDGDGTQEFIYLDKRGHDTYSWYFNAGFQRDLVVGVQNGAGAKTTIKYTPSSAWSNKGLPPGFVTQTVSAVTVEDGRGGSSTVNYRYEGGRYSRAERRFLGFRKVTAVTHASGSTIETYYVQRIGSLSKPEIVRHRDPEGRILSYEDFRYQENEGAPYTSLLTEKWDVVCNGSERCRKVLTRFAYDRYGNVIEVREHGDIARSGDERTTVRAYGENKDRYIVGLPAYEKVYAGLRATGDPITAQQYHYDGANTLSAPPQRGLVTAVRRWLGGDRYVEARTEYDDYGNVIAQVDERGSRSTVSYDPELRTYPAQRCNALGHCVQITWDAALGRELTSTDANGARVSHRYDALGRKIAQTSPTGAVTRIEYRNDGDPAAQHTARYLPDGSAEGLWQREYRDGLGRVYKREKKGGLVQLQEFEGSSRKVKRSTPWQQQGAEPLWTEREYDGLGQLVATTAPDGARWRHRYAMDRAGAPIEVQTGPLGQGKIIWRDHEGRLTQVAEQLRESYLYTTYRYDARGRLIQTVDAEGHAATVRWDRLDRKVEGCDKQVGCWRYGYDAGGLLAYQVDARGDKITYRYDALGRKVKETSASGATRSWSYDDPSQGPSLGRLTGSTATRSRESYRWDAMGHRVATEICIDTICRTTRFEYDRYARKVAMVYPDGERLTYRYNHRGLITSAGRYVLDVSYSDDDQPAAIRFGNFVEAKASWDPRRRWQLGYHLTTEGGTFSETLQRDALGNVVGRTSGNDATRYRYDGLSRLVAAEGAGGQRIAYSPLGNIYYHSTGGRYDYRDGAHPHRVTHFAGREFAYDANGFTVDDGQRQMTWDPWHQLATVKRGAAAITYFYNAAGQRILSEKGDGGKFKTMTFSRYWHEVDGKPVKSYYLGDRLVARQEASGQLLWLHQNHLGSLVLTTDEAGKPVHRLEYDPFGARTVHNLGEGAHPGVGFTGHITDGESGLIYMNARYYDPELRRFISPDTVIPDPARSQAYLRYAYVYNNPLTQNDPSGHVPVVAAVVSVAVAASTATSAIVVAAAVIGAGLTTVGYFTNNETLMTIGGVMLGFAGGATTFQGLTNAAVAFATSPHSPFGPEVRRAIGWAYFAYGLLGRSNQDVFGADDPQAGSALQEAHGYVAAGKSVPQSTMRRLAEATGVKVDEWQSFFNKLPDLRRNPLLRNAMGQSPLASHAAQGFWGSGSQLYYGELVARRLGRAGLTFNRWEAVLLNPTGGLTGPGSSSLFLRGGVLGWHSVIHDADGFSRTAFGVGGGYGAWPHPGLSGTSPLSGQIGGLAVLTVARNGGLPIR